MKVIGLLGGTSWPSSIAYYDTLNRIAQERLSGHHSARILLYSVDYHNIKSLYHDGWDKIPALLASEIRFFLKKEPDCLIICNNTLHRAFDKIRDKLNIAIPVFHAGHLAAEEAQRQGRKTVLLLGTAFTMEDGFFAKYFEDKGIHVVVPCAEDRQLIQTMQSDIARGNIDPSYADVFTSILKRRPQSEAVVLACTELPLVITSTNSPLPIIDPAQCQCKAAAQYAFG